MERHKIGNINVKLTCVLFRDIKQEAAEVAVGCIYFFYIKNKNSSNIIKI